MYLARTPAFLQRLFPKRLWRGSATEKVLHFTFDDGPVPGVTPWVLDVLREHGAKATFFVVGNNAARNPDLLARIRSDGHAIGNHTWDHLNGWSTSQRSYLRNVLRAQQLTGSCLFRPPYGRITGSQAHALEKRYKVVMWDVLSADFDARVSNDRCLHNVIDNARPGSIIVFHDSLKAEPRLRYALPRCLAHFKDQGYMFKSLPQG